MQEQWTQEDMQRFRLTGVLPEKCSMKLPVSPVQEKTKAKAASQGRYGKRHIKGEMNKTEEAYSDLLESQKKSGEIIEWWFEAVTLRYAKDGRFTTDFLVLLADGTFELVDCKGGIVNEASTVRAKACADKFWAFTFVQVQKLPKKSGWKRTVL